MHKHGFHLSTHEYFFGFISKTTSFRISSCERMWGLFPRSLSTTIPYISGGLISVSLPG